MSQKPKKTPETPPEKIPEAPPLKKKIDGKVLRDAYFQILEGYTPATLQGESVWIKHFGIHEQTDVDRHYQGIYDEVREKGLPTEEESLAKLKEDGYWSDEEDAEIAQVKKVIEGLYSNKVKALNKGMETIIEQTIEEREKFLHEKEEKKNSLLHDTCEEFAEKRTNDWVVKLAFHKNKEGERCYSDEEFDNLSRGEIVELVMLYNECTQTLTNETVKEIASQDFFTSYYTLVQDSPATFFDKPVHEFTFYQVNLLSYARIVSSILKNFDPPDKIKNDTKALLAFASTESKKRKKEQRAPGPRNNPPVVGR